MKRKSKKFMLGLGFDHRDGHKRITKGDNFILLGGSRITHEQMTEKAIKLNEHLKKKGKSLDQVSHKEFEAIAHKLNLQPMRFQ